jgi:hypothetical protein
MSKSAPPLPWYDHGKREAGMEDLILAFVTFVASMFILSHLAGAGMDAFTIVMFVASIPLVGYLAYERGLSHRRWAYVAAVIGPFAIPMLYCVAAISAFRKMIHPKKPDATISH